MKGSSSLENRILFLLLITFEVLHLFYLVLNHRMPLGHDGFQYFSLQYFFLNDSAINHETPLWIPYVNHGIVATWWYTLQGTMGLLPNALLLAGKSIASINFLDIFHYGIFFNRLILLTGVWLLGERYFESALTRFFVASCVMGSTVTMTQFKFTLLLFYAVPLLIYFGHTFLDTGRWRYFFLACNLFVIQMIGNDAYFFPIITLTLFLYFLFYALDQTAYFNERIKSLKWGMPSLIAITAGLLSIGLLAAIFMAGKDPALINLNYGRNLDGSTPINIFLTYAGNMDFQKWQEFILRISPALDFTIYMGYLSLPLIFFGIFFSQNKIKKTLLLVILILIFFSMGTWISLFFYYVWPMMKFYRHLALIVPIIKLLLLFLAGLGFEKLFIQRETWQGNRIASYTCLILGVLLLLLSKALVDLAQVSHDSSQYIFKSLALLLPHMPWDLDPYTVNIRLSEASIYAMLLGLLLMLLPLIPFKKYSYAIILTALFINACDIYSYYCTEMNHRTFHLNKDQYKITAFSPTPYSDRRIVAAPNPRQILLSSPLLIPKYLYVTTNAFLFQDALGTRYRTDERLRPAQEMIAAFGRKIFDNKAFLKIAGSSADKIQFFNQACASNDPKQLASFLNAPQYSGDTLLLSGNNNAQIMPCTKDNVLINNRMELLYKIKSFTPNILELSVNQASTKPVWMMYSDVWHQGWTAKINGKKTPVFKGDLAYKAILLPPGKNTVKFEFIAPPIVLLEKIMAFNALGWLLLLLYFIIGILTKIRI